MHCKIAVSKRVISNPFAAIKIINYLSCKTVLIIKTVRDAEQENIMFYTFFFLLVKPGKLLHLGPFALLALPT